MPELNRALASFPTLSSSAARGSTHRKVGQVAVFQTFSHDVSGIATIVEDCTIRFDMFNFDGGGIDIRVYVAPDGDDTFQGVSISENLKNFPVGYSNVRLAFDIGDNSLDDIDGVSIWCVPVGVSFGDGLFKPAQ